jgi:hypothetical protein
VVKISSKKQKGGITAQHVTTTTHIAEKRPSYIKKAIYYFVGFVGFVAAIFTILDLSKISVF